MTGCFAASQSPLQSTNNPNPAVNPEDGMSGDKEPTAGIMGAPVTSRPRVGAEINIHQLLGSDTFSFKHEFSFVRLFYWYADIIWT